MKMKNEKLIWKALKMLHARARYWEKNYDFIKASTYQSAHDILLYALDGNEECLRQFNTYEEEK